MRVNSMVMFVCLMIMLLVPSWREGDASPRAIAKSTRALPSGAMPVASSVQTITSDTPPSVDGAKTPELVPDDVAYRHFIMAAAAPDNPTSEEASRRAGYVARLGLSADDRGRALSALRSVRDNLDALKREQALLTDNSPESRAARMVIKNKKDAILKDAVTRLRSSVSAEGSNRVHTFVLEHVKRHVRIYGDAQR